MRFVRQQDGRDVVLEVMGDRVAFDGPELLTEAELFWLCVVAGPAALSALRARLLAAEGQSDRAEG